MAIRALLAVIEDQLTQALEARNLPVPTFGMGRLVPAKDRAPLIRWNPTTETIGPPEGRGGDGIGNPSPLWTRKVSIEAHIWCEKDDANQAIDACEALANHLIAAMQAGVGLFGAYAPTAGRWYTGEEAVTARGAVYVLTFVVQVPFTREVDPIALVTSIPLTGTVVPLGS